MHSLIFAKREQPLPLVISLSLQLGDLTVLGEMLSWLVGFPFPTPLQCLSNHSLLDQAPSLNYENEEEIF